MVYRDKRERGVTRLHGAAPLVLTDVLKAVYPVGSYYMSESSTSPATLFGFGTWIQVKGRMIIGVDSADVDWDTAGDVGGEKTHVLTEAEMADHTHGGSSLVVDNINSGHTHGAGLLKTNINRRAQAGTTGGVAMGAGTSQPDLQADVIQDTNAVGAGHIHGITGSTGTGTGQNRAHNNMPPFIAAYMWRRTA